MTRLYRTKRRARARWRHWYRSPRCSVLFAEAFVGLRFRAIIQAHTEAKIKDIIKSATAIWWLWSFYKLKAMKESWECKNFLIHPQQVTKYEAIMCDVLTKRFVDVHRPQWNGNGRLSVLGEVQGFTYPPLSRHCDSHAHWSGAYMYKMHMHKYILVYTKMGESDLSKKTPAGLGLVLHTAPYTQRVYCRHNIQYIPHNRYPSSRPSYWL